MHTRNSLIEHVGGYPTPAERLIIESASIKSVRLFLLTEKLLTDGTSGCDQSDEKTIAWLNSLRLDLMALGLGRRIKDVSPSLKDILDGASSFDAERDGAEPPEPGQKPAKKYRSPAREAQAKAQSARAKRWWAQKAAETERKAITHEASPP